MPADRRNTKGPQVLDQMNHAVVIVQVDDIDREHQPDRVDTLAGNQPEPFIRVICVSAGLTPRLKNDCRV